MTDDCDAEIGAENAAVLCDETKAAAEQGEREPDLPPGDYAIVEIMGHQSLVGRIAEVTRFGAGMLQIEPIFDGALLPPVLQGGAAIYRLTPCSPATAFARAPKASQRWALPDAIKATLPPALLVGPDPKREPLVIDEEAFLRGDSSDCTELEFDDDGF